MGVDLDIPDCNSQPRHMTTGLVEYRVQLLGARGTGTEQRATGGLDIYSGGTPFCEHAEAAPFSA